MKRIARWPAIIVLSAGGLVSQISSACSCGAVGLESRFESATQVFTATITGRAQTQGDGEDMPRVDFGFAVIETFKGDVPFQVLTSWGSSASCGIDLTTGVDYLIFTGDKGSVGLCAGISPVTDNGQYTSHRGRGYLRALRAFKSGETERVTEPWLFSEDDNFCTAGLQNLKIDEDYSSISIGFTFIKELPENAVTPPDFEFTPRFISPSIRLIQRWNDPPTSIRLSAGPEQFIADALPEESWGSNYSVSPDDAADLLAALIEHSALTLHWNQSTGPVQVRVPVRDVDDTLIPLRDCAGINTTNLGDRDR